MSEKHKFAGRVLKEVFSLENKTWKNLGRTAILLNYYTIDSSHFPFPAITEQLLFFNILGIW